MRILKFSRIYSILFFVLLITCSISCVKSSVQSVTNTAPAFSYVSIMNLAPYGDSTKIYFNGTVYSQVFNQGELSTSYFKVSSGNYGVQFKTASSKDSLLATIPASPFDSLKFYTLIVYNDSANGPVKAVKIADDYSTITATTSGYRFFNMSPDIASVDLYINGVKVQANRTPADNVLNTVYNNFQTVASLYSTVEVKLAGTNTAVATALNGSINEANAYTFFLEERHTATGNQFALNLLKSIY